MAETALDQPVHLTTHSDEPIRSLDAAARVIHRHVAGRIDPKALAVLRIIADASSPRAVADAARAFRRWAMDEGLLLVPPEDRRNRWNARPSQPR